jgi:flagellar basal-body rod protein FlgC
MSTIYGIAQSGIEAAARRLDVSADDVANALTDGFVPGRLDAAEAPDGGVTTTVSRGADPLAEVRADRALLVGSGTDLVREVVAQSQAAAIYKANLATLKVADEVAEAVVRLKE